MIDWLGIKGKMVVATRGSSGIGRSIVKSLLAQEVYVANFDISASEAQHEHLFFIKVDVTSQAEVEAGIAQVIEKFGTVDGLVNNAGINIPCLLVDRNHPHGPYELSDKVFDKIVAINRKGLYLMSQAVDRILVQKQAGAIINMSSEAGSEGPKGQSVYAATKATVSSYAHSWAKELGRSNVRIVGITPGIMEETGLRILAYGEALAYTRNIPVGQLRAGYSKTNTIPLSRNGKSHKIADLVCYYLSDRLSYITGITTNVTGDKIKGQRQESQMTLVNRQYQTVKLLTDHKGMSLQELQEKLAAGPQTVRKNIDTLNDELIGIT